MERTSEPVSIDIYPELCHEEDLTPDCGVEVDGICQGIHDAVDGWGASKKGLIEALGKTVPEERLKVSLRYKDMFEKDLYKVMKSEVSGDFGKCMKYLSLNPVEAECAMIKDACKGVGSDKPILYSILCGRSNKDIDLLKKTYYKKYTKDLMSTIDSESGGDLSKMFCACLQGAEEEFDPDFHTEDKAREDADEMYEAGQGSWGTNEEVLFKMIIMSPPKYLALVNDVYADKYGYTLVKALEKELGGYAAQAAIFTVNMRLKPYEAIAALIKSACAGVGTDEDLLTCCIIRYQDIMGHVNLAHEEMYGKSVHDRVRHECGGKYEDLLIALLNTVCPE